MLNKLDCGQRLLGRAGGNSSAPNSPSELSFSSSKRPAKQVDQNGEKQDQEKRRSDEDDAVLAAAQALQPDSKHPYWAEFGRNFSHSADKVELWRLFDVAEAGLAAKPAGTLGWLGRQQQADGSWKVRGPPAVMRLVQKVATCICNMSQSDGSVYGMGFKDVKPVCFSHGVLIAWEKGKRSDYVVKRVQQGMFGSSKNSLSIPDIIGVDRWLTSTFVFIYSILATNEPARHLRQTKTEDAPVVDRKMKLKEHEMMASKAAQLRQNKSASSQMVKEMGSPEVSTLKEECKLWENECSHLLGQVQKLKTQLPDSKKACTKETPGLESLWKVVATSPSKTAKDVMDTSPKAKEAVKEEKAKPKPQPAAPAPDLLDFAGPPTGTASSSSAPAPSQAGPIDLIDMDFTPAPAAAPPQVGSEAGEEKGSSQRSGLPQSVFKNAGKAGNAFSAGRAAQSGPRRGDDYSDDGLPIASQGTPESLSREVERQPMKSDSRSSYSE